MPNLPTEEVFTTPDPERADGHVTATKPLVLADGTVVRGLRVRFEGGRAVQIDADTRAGHHAHDRSSTTRAPPASARSRWSTREGRIGKLDTVFYDTLIDENAASHIALGQGFPFLLDDDRAASNESQIHIDFMIGSPDDDGHRHHRRGRARPGARRRRMADLRVATLTPASRRGAGAAERARLEIV